MNKQTKQVIAEVLKIKGKNFAVLCAVEEMAELTKNLLKDINRGKDNMDGIFEEICDVVITLEYLKIIYGISESQIWAELNKKIPSKWLPRIQKWKQGACVDTK